MISWNPCMCVIGMSRTVPAPQPHSSCSNSIFPQSPGMAMWELWRPWFVAEHCNQCDLRCTCEANALSFVVENSQHNSQHKKKCANLYVINTPKTYLLPNPARALIIPLKERTRTIGKSIPPTTHTSPMCQRSCATALRMSARRPHHQRELRTWMLDRKPRDSAYEQKLQMNHHDQSEIIVQRQFTHVCEGKVIHIYIYIYT